MVLLYRYSAVFFLFLVHVLQNHEHSRALLFAHRQYYHTVLSKMVFFCLLAIFVVQNIIFLALNFVRGRLCLSRAPPRGAIPCSHTQTRRRGSYSSVTFLDSVFTRFFSLLLLAFTVSPAKRGTTCVEIQQPSCC